MLGWKKSSTYAFAYGLRMTVNNASYRILKIIVAKTAVKAL